MASLKRSRSLADFFRPSPSRSPSTRRPSPSPPAGTATLSTAAISSPLEADYSPAQPQNPFHSDASARPTIDTTQQQQQQLPRSGTQELDDILGAYGDSPTKTRFPPHPERTDSAYSASTADSTRDRIDTMPVLAGTALTTPGASSLDPSSARTGGRTPLKISTRSNTSGAGSRPHAQPRSKSNGELDLIDRLDISGLYGGGGFVRHEGPYAAASGSRSPGGHAPIDAFDPSAFTLSTHPSRPSASQTPSSSSSSSLSAPAPSSLRRKGAASNGLSERAQAALGAMDSLDGGGRGGPYGAARGAAPREVSMGFPGKQQDGKSAQLMEIYGFRDAEAWEDYGTARYDPASAAASRDSVVPAGVSKQDRMERAQSIWDIEATLRAGKPVGSAPPPVPVIPAEWSAPDVSPSAKPKRSKSLAARFRAGRRNPNNPINIGAGDGNDSAGSAEDGREAGQARSTPVTPVEDRRGARELPVVTPLSASVGPGGYGGGGGGSAFSPAGGEGGDVDRLGERTAAIKFDESVERERSSGMVRTASAPNGSGGGGGGGGGDFEERKKGGGLKRLFSTKRKG
ncbi:hypothetical protein JCM6882_006440 [Rhodosporidiobolus microsporus]